MTPILVEMKKNLGTKDFFINFYGRRALRIFPLYFGYLFAITFIFLYVMDEGNYQADWRIPVAIDQLPYAYTYTLNFFHATEYFTITTYLSHFWSLAVEEQFYLVWPFLLFFTPVKKLKTLLLVLIVLAPVFRFVTYIVASEEIIPFLHNRLDVVIYVLPFSYLDAFAIGGFFALYRSSIPASSVWALMLVTVLIGFLTDYRIPANFREYTGLGYTPFMKYEYKFIWGYSLLNIVIAFILVGIRDRRFIPALFENRIMVYLGKISYGLYVFHFPVIWIVSHYLVPNYPLPQYSAKAIALSITIILSVISYELMEKKFIGLKDIYFSKKTGKNTDVSDGVSLVNAYKKS